LLSYERIVIFFALYKIKKLITDYRDGRHHAKSFLSISIYYH